MDNLEPGCFGKVVCYEPQSKTCKICKHSSECDDLVRKQVNDMESYMDVKDLKKRIGVKVKSKYEGGSVKVANIISSLEKRGIDVQGSLDRGRNPLGSTDKPAFLREAFTVALKFNSVKSKDISNHYREVFPTWSDRTITNQTSIAVKVVASLKLDNK